MPRFDFLKNVYGGRFCQDHSLSLEKMTESKQSQGELLQALVGTSYMLYSQPYNRNVSCTYAHLNDPKVDTGFLRSVQEGLSLIDSKVNRNASSHKIVAAAYCAGLYPQLAKVTIHCYIDSYIYDDKISD